MTRRTFNAINSVMLGDCIGLMRGLDAGSIDFILTDPPYLVNYRDRSGRTIAGDSNGSWLQPAFAEMYRVLQDGGFCVSFYGWNSADKFISAWRAAGFTIVGHVVFRKNYASSVRFLRYQHEMAYLLAKGAPELPARPVSDVIDYGYTGNRLHPTQKPVACLTPLIEAYAPRLGVVLDPFAGSGSTGVAALQCRRRCILIEKDDAHNETIRERFKNLPHHLTTALRRTLPSNRKTLLSHMETLIRN